MLNDPLLYLSLCISTSLFVSSIFMFMCCICVFQKQSFVVSKFMNVLSFFICIWMFLNYGYVAQTIDFSQKECL